MESSERSADIAGGIRVQANLALLLLTFTRFLLHILSPEYKHQDDVIRNPAWRYF